ncbi:Uncharacterised protein [Mycobacterium tuberculosis]|nr:Uncharacterised protein [Mycobacterium tuberculosis]
MDLVAETAMFLVCSPKVSCIAVASGRSPAGVLVACALMCTTVFGSMLPSSRASRSARVAPSAAGSGAVMW